jgi:hypothetical protein
MHAPTTPEVQWNVRRVVRLLASGCAQNFVLPAQFSQQNQILTP